MAFKRVLFAHAATCALITTAQYVTAQPLISPIPEPFVVDVKVPDAFSDSGDCFSCDVGAERLELVERDIVLHRVKLDDYRGDLTGWLLQFERGFNRQWNPAWQIRVYPSGLDQNGTAFVVVLGHEPLMFKPRHAADGTVTFAPQSAAPFSLSRDGDQLILRRANEKAWSFTSYDGGRSFQLTKIESLTRMEDVVQLEYTGSELTQVIYPDGAATILEYQNGVVEKITLPSGRYVRFVRDDYGWVEELQFFHPVHTIKKEILHVVERKLPGNDWQRVSYWRNANTESGTFTHRFRYENDAKGRITRFENACGSAFRLEYSFAKVGESETYTTVEVDEATRAYRFMREQFGTERRTEFGRAAAGVPVAEAKVMERRVTGVHSHTLVTLESWNYRDGLTSYESVAGEKNSASGQAESTPPGAEAVRSSDDDIAEDAPVVDDVTRRRMDEFGFLHVTPKILETDTLGRETKVRDLWGRTWIYEWGAALRMTRCLRPDGSECKWRWNRLGQIEEMSERALDGSVRVWSYGYNKRGQVVRCGLPDGGENRYTWECGKLKLWRNWDGFTIEWRYDSHGRVSGMLRSDEGEYRYGRDARGFVRVEGFRADAAQPWELTRYEYDALGRQVTIDDGAGPKRTVINNEGLTLRIHHPSGSVAYRYFDRHGRFVAEKGGDNRPIFRDIQSSPDAINVHADYYYDDEAIRRLAIWAGENPELAAHTETFFPSDSNSQIP